MKFKIPTKDFIKISIDRLTRFKPVGERYERVFSEILNKHLIFDGHKIDNVSLDEKIKLAVEIFNSPFGAADDFTINEIIKKDEEKIFYLNRIEKKYLDSKINFKGALSLFEPSELPLNLRTLKLLEEGSTLKTREKFSTLYPVSRVILVEGITEEILLIEFARLLGLDFKAEGIFVLSAGGKNQVAKKYYRLVEEIKIPIFILLDLDALETLKIISPKLRKGDRIYKIKSGEFEDILGEELIQNALNKHFEQNTFQTFKESKGAVCSLNECYKNNGWGEFKKADFAKIIKEYLDSAKNPPISEELVQIIKKIKSIEQSV